MKIEHNFEHNGYMSIAMRPDILLKHRAKLVKYLRQFEFDAIAFRGHSGALLAAPLAMAMKKTLMLVRKNNSDSHACQLVEGDHACRRYLIVDDFVACGDTVRAIFDAVKGFASNAKCAGVFEVNRCFNNITLDYTGIGEIVPVRDREIFCELRKVETNV